jgi:hypothetical protein
MNHLAAKMKGPLKMFMERFGKYLRDDDYQQFFSNRRQAGRETFLSSDFYRGEKLSSVILEEYSARGKLRGNVMLVYPDPGWDVPIFMFQLGGNGRQSIALLDIVPTLPGINFEPLIPAWERYRTALRMKPSQVPWINKICSPYLLHCQYGELDTQLFLEATEAYLDVWIRHYYEPGRRIENQTDLDIVANALYRYKHVLHANDPAYGIFKKAWGKPVADAFHFVESQEFPSLPMPDEADPYAPVWENPDLNVMWTLAAQRRLEREPAAAQAALRLTIEQRARAQNFGMITPDVYERLRGATAVATSGQG